MKDAVYGVKLFCAYQQDIAILEDEINQWLTDKSDIHIIHMAQSEISKKRDWDIIVTFLYEEPTGS